MKQDPIAKEFWKYQIRCKQVYHFALQKALMNGLETGNEWVEKVNIDLSLANILVLRAGHVIKVQLFCCLADKRMKVEFEKDL